jgi:hypothetical protein
MALRSVRMNNTKVSKMYFSNENIKRIQKQIKNSVYEISKGRFKMAVDQDEGDLIISMRFIFLELSYFHFLIQKQINLLKEEIIGETI